jgi:hypothetical protein
LIQFPWHGICCHCQFRLNVSFYPTFRKEKGLIKKNWSGTKISARTNHIFFNTWIIFIRLQKKSDETFDVVWNFRNCFVFMCE